MRGRNAPIANRPSTDIYEFYEPNATERRVLDILLRRGSVSRADLKDQIGVTQPTISRLVSNLIDRGLVRLGDKAITGPGQPSTMLSLVPDYAYSLGISLLGDSLGFDLMDFSGRLLGRRAVAPVDMSRPVVLDQLVNQKENLIAEADIDPARLFAAGIGVSAFFLEDRVRMNPPALLDDWADIDIAKYAARALDLPVTVDNDGNMAAISELHIGAGTRYDSFAYFHITNGFGGGIILDGRQFRGTYGNSGEFAAIWIAAGIEHPNLEHLRRWLADKGLEFDSVAKMLVDTDDKWHIAFDWVDQVAPAYSLCASAASATLDVEAIVIGGRLPKALAAQLADKIIIAATERRGQPRPLPDVLSSEIDADPVSVGSATAAFQNAFF